MILEGIVDDIRKKYPNDRQAVDALVKNVKPKYLEWAAKQVLEKMEPADEVEELVRMFDREKNRLTNKDLNSYSALADLRDAFERSGPSKGQQRKLAKGEAERILEDENIVVMRPRTAAASCFYGAGTKWCVSATESMNMFDSYSSRNVVFYFVINRARPVSDPLHKIAIVVPRDENNEPSARESVHAFNSLDQLMRINDAVSAIPNGHQVVDSCIAHSRTIPINPQYEISHTTNPRRLRDLIEPILSDPANDQSLVRMREDLPAWALEVIVPRWKGSFREIMLQKNMPDHLSRQLMVPEHDEEMLELRKNWRADQLEPIVARWKGNPLLLLAQKNLPEDVLHSILSRNTDDDISLRVDDGYGISEITARSITALEAAGFDETLRALFGQIYLLLDHPLPHDVVLRLFDKFHRSGNDRNPPVYNLVRYGIDVATARDLLESNDPNVLNGLAANKKVLVPDVLDRLCEKVPQEGAEELIYGMSYDGGKVGWDTVEKLWKRLGTIAQKYALEMLTDSAPHAVLERLRELSS